MPITKAEQRSLQMNAANTLTRLLHAAHAAGLPPINWTVVNALPLLGQVSPSSDSPDARAVFERWRKFLKGGSASQSTDADGTTVLRAAVPDWGGQPITLMCRLYPAQGA